MLKKRYFKTKDEFEVTFTYAGDAENVHLLTSANDWVPVPMKASKGVYTAKLRIPANGQYQFRYLVNNTDWVNDEEADSYVPNEHGTENGVIDTSVS
jgi:1,4-alpha-glucan branching enzyme